jgi:DNA modification methylase
VNTANTLYYGDNLDSLRKHVRDETVDLCYIDPPFNSKRNYNQIYNNVGKEDAAQAQAFVDTWTWDDQADEGFQEIIANEKGRYATQTVALIKGLRDVLGNGSLLAYLVSMTRRIVEIHRSLKPTGSFYLHCDPTSSHYLKIVLDAIFQGRFRNEIIWKRTSGRKSGSQFGRIHDVVLFYTKGDASTWNAPTTLQDAASARGHDLMRDEGGTFRVSDFSGAGQGPARTFAERGELHPPSGRHWMFDQKGVDRLFSEGRIIFSASGRPRLKTYLQELPGISVNDLWTDIEPINSAAQERLGYPTQKPEALLERMIKASSNEGDIILDAYCGCGTTVAVAQSLNRRWIGMDITYQSVSLILKRLQDKFGKDVRDAVKLNGVPKDMESATALANKADDRTRKEFEKWAVLTYTENRGRINDKKGADAGIDGTAFFLTSKTDNDKMVFQVKSGHVGRGDIAKLKGDMQREGAALATFITLAESTGPMRAEAKTAGFYTHTLTGRRYDQIQIVSVQDILNGGRMDLPLSLDVVKAAERAVAGDQLPFDLQ